MTNGFKKMLFVLWILAVVVLVSALYILPGIKGTLKKTYLAEYDSVRVSDQVDCYLIRDEVLVRAGNAGATTYYYEEGTKLRKGTTLMKVGDTPCTAEYTGIISYFSDGLESDCSPDNLSNLKKETLEDENAQVENLVAGSAESDQPLLKIVRGTQWNIVFWADKESVVNYKKGNSVSVAFADDRITARISDIFDSQGEYLVVLKTTQFSKDYVKDRKRTAEILTVDEQGLRLKSSSLVTKDGQVGVYVKKLNAEYQFTPVKVYSIIGEDVLVASENYIENSAGGGVKVSTVKAYDEILTDGTGVKEEKTSSQQGGSSEEGNTDE